MDQISKKTKMISQKLTELKNNGIQLKDITTEQSSLESIFLNLLKEKKMNWHGLKAIYLHEMERMRRTLFQSLVSPMISTSLYFVVFGSAIGSRITEIDGVSYGSFIVPGMIMLTILTQSISNASFGIFLEELELK